MHSATKEFTIPDISTTQVSFVQSNNIQPSTSQIGTPQISSDQNSSFEVSQFQVSPTEVDTTKVSSTSPSTFSNLILPDQFRSGTSSKINSTQINPTKIPLSSSISSQQLLSIHTLTPESITTINSTAQTLWNTLLAPQNPFDMNLQLTDSLAKGQLAEAIVTKYDDRGRPIGGTIEVDPTANGTVAVHRPHYNRPRRIQPNPQQHRLSFHHQQ